ncbi:intraflagellar transport protein 46 homolog isoform X2 [Venturia canescens]|uniref:intraflagellar transport protein 46 homolog isoform X2 n=1 Tax=Venturia canescens TaxID=32260 RepID=UPI001C9BC8D5|nr:intraflagellar transport protein 46 homolog isoform X2 [Venturia canescens]
MESSEDEETQNISAFSKFDESIEVKNAEDIKSPVNSRPSTMQKRAGKHSTVDSNDNLRINSPRGKREFDRYSGNDHSFDKVMAIGSDPSDSEETDDDDIQATNPKTSIELYDHTKFDDLDVSVEVKELFQNITRYTPQKIEPTYKLIPFIPDFIPAVGDIDAFIKVPRPDGVADKVGLAVLDEPCANQSDPAVLHLQLRSQSKSADPRKQTLIKRVENAEKHPKALDKWIEDMGQLHRSKNLPTVNLTKPMPDIDGLMQEWPPEIEEKLTETRLDLAKLDCSLAELVDIVCNLFDIPVHGDSRIESLHTLFTLFLEVREMKGRKY